MEVSNQDVAVNRSLDRAAATADRTPEVREKPRARETERAAPATESAERTQHGDRRGRPVDILV